MQLVRRTLAVLTHLADERALSMQQLSADLDVPMPSMHRLLGVLADEGYVVRTDDRRYVLGPAAIGLARGTRPVEDVARPIMRDLAATYAETVFLTQLVGRQAVCVAIVEGSRALRLFVHVGQVMPFHAAASARAILAFRPEAEIAELLRFPARPYTSLTPVSASQVMAHLADVRAKGYDVCADELDPNVLAVSAPIRNRSGEVEASITIAAPAERHDGAAGVWGEHLVRSAATISRHLGWVESLLTRTSA